MWIELLAIKHSQFCLPLLYLSLQLQELYRPFRESTAITKETGSSKTALYFHKTKRLQIPIFMLTFLKNSNLAPLLFSTLPVTSWSSSATTLLRIPFHCFLSRRCLSFFISFPFNYLDFNKVFCCPLPRRNSSLGITSVGSMCVTCVVVDLPVRA